MSKKLSKALQLSPYFNGLMAVESDKISSSDCNLSQKVLGNNSNNEFFLPLYCHSRISHSETTVVMNLSCTSTATATSPHKRNQPIPHLFLVLPVPVEPFLQHLLLILDSLGNNREVSKHDYK